MDYNPLLQINLTYTHYKNKQSYQIIDFCKIQENDIWIEAVIYKPIECNELFVRSKKEFDEKFLLKN